MSTEHAALEAAYKAGWHDGVDACATGDYDMSSRLEAALLAVSSGGAGEAQPCEHEWKLILTRARIDRYQCVRCSELRHLEVGESPPSEPRAEPPVGEVARCEYGPRGEHKWLQNVQQCEWCGERRRVSASPASYRIAEMAGDIVTALGINPPGEDAVAHWDQVVEAVRVLASTASAQQRPTLEAVAKAVADAVRGADVFHGDLRTAGYYAPSTDAEVLSTAAVRAVLALYDAPAQDAQTGSAQAKPDTRRDCTCLGTCKGPDGLGPNWRCVLGRSPDTHTPPTQEEA
jgi:hypothetical protein